MRTLKKWDKRKRRLLLWINLLCVLLFVGDFWLAKSQAQSLGDQQVAKRWQNEEAVRLAQIGVFFSKEKNVQQSQIDMLRGGLLQKLYDDSYYQKEQTGRVMIDSFSGECEVDLRKDTQIVSATAVGVGNDFFRFHQMKLLTGSYIYEEDLNHDRVILDHNLAWTLFGSVDVVGMKLWMGNYIYTVAGVVEKDENALSKVAYGDTNRIYIMYDDLKQHCEELSITNYEVVMPNPITNYARNAVGENCQMDLEELDTMGKDGLVYGDCEILDQTVRFKSAVLLSKRKQKSYKSMRLNGICYPYWENVARGKEDKLLTLLLIRMILAIPPIATVVWVGGLLWSQRTFTLFGLIKNWNWKMFVKKKS